MKELHKGISVKRAPKKDDRSACLSVCVCCSFLSSFVCVCVRALMRLTAYNYFSTCELIMWPISNYVCIVYVVVKT